MGRRDCNYPVRVVLLASSLLLIVADGAAYAQSGSSPAATPKAPTIEQRTAEYYAQCMKYWDADTHMTKQEWSRTCRRVNDERVKFRVENKMRLP